MSAGIVWFRNDLRLGCNPVWAEATIRHATVIALYVIDRRLRQSAGAQRIGALVDRLRALDRDLAEAGGRLRVWSGDARSIVPRQAGGVDAVYWNGDVTPYATARDAAMAEALAGRAHEHDGRFVHEPGSIKTADGEPYRAFTPFYRRWAAHPVEPRPDAGRAQVSADLGDGLPDVEVRPVPTGEREARGFPGPCRPIRRGAGSTGSRRDVASLGRSQVRNHRSAGCGQPRR